MELSIVATSSKKRKKDDRYSNRQTFHFIFTIIGENWQWSEGSYENILYLFNKR